MAKTKRKYRIVGIKSPGTVDLYPYGTINLFDQSDEKLEEIKNKTGCSFIQPEIDAPDPKKDISVEKPSRKTDS